MVWRRMSENLFEHEKRSYAKGKQTLSDYLCVCVSRKYQEVLLFTKYQLSYLGNKLCMTPWSWEWGEKAWNARPDKVYANSRTVLYLAAFYKRNDVRDGEGILKHDSSLSRWPKPTNRTSPRQTCQETFYARNLCVTFFFFSFSFKKRKKNLYRIRRKPRNNK